MPETRTHAALDTEDWAYFTSGGIQKHTLQDAIEAGERGRRDLNSHALAALCLYGQPFGFTRDDVETLRLAATNLHHFGLVTLADRIEALLPPA